MAPKERTEIVDNLERSRQDFMAAVAGVTEAQAQARPDHERWSVLDCVEHVTTVEERFLGWLEAAKKLDQPRIDKEKEAGLMARIPDRSTRAKSPEAALPTGRFATLGQALEQFNLGRTRSIEFAQDRCDDLYCLASEHPRFGPMNGVEFLIIIAGHSRRHAAQILETRAALGEA
ncbi:MAG: DinB family protein [Bryobacteraceae bacterium]|jgi:hypothetical protein